MENYFRLITLFLIIGLVGPNFLSAQQSTITNEGKTRFEAHKASIKNQQDLSLSRSMMVSFTSGYDSELLENKLEYNSCVELANISINIVDGINQIGTFSNGIAGAGLQIDEGVVLSTGTIAEMFTDNNQVLVSEGFSDANTIADIDFDNLDPGGQSTHNESILILDFTVPPGLDGIRVPFQFASDEYPEYVGTQFNDVFGFFVSGPGFSETTNIALVPGSSIPIAVNSINGGTISNQVNANNYPASGEVHLDHSAYYIDNTDGTNGGPIIGEYDGYSTLLYAEVSGLTPGETYQLKLGIADIADHYGDSGVYIGPLEGLYTGEPIVDCYCDIDNDNLDCDKDGILNGVDCDPSDASVAVLGDPCFDSNGDEGLIDENCICIASAGGISGGNSGGLESNNRLAQKIAKRNFNRKIDPKNIDLKKDRGEIPFKRINGQMRQSEGLELNQIIPLDIWGAYIAESTPTDLIEITNATEILAADYYLDNFRSAVVMAIKSENGVYEHSKYICDRLDGASLLDVYYSTVLNKKFITYKIETATGLIEYATSFSGHESNGKIEIENHWNLDKYPYQDTYYNFQIWSSSIEKTKSLLISILNNIEIQMPIGEVSTGTIPSSFVSNGYYENGKLHLNILNKDLLETLEFQGRYRETETSELLDFNEVVNTKLTEEETLVIEVGYLYDMGISMIIDENHSDELFIADGTWGYDDQASHSNVVDFNITSQMTVFDDHVFGIERGIEVEASVKNYQNIFRSVTPKWQSVDLSVFNTIGFEALGNGMIQLTIVSDDIDDWEKQLSFQLVLNEELTEYEISISDFENYTSNIDLSSINMMMISLVGNGVAFESKSLGIYDINFSSMSETTSSEEVSSFSGIDIYPNPADDILSIEFKSQQQKDGLISVYTATGKRQMVMKMNAGQESIHINISELVAGHYFVKIINGDRVMQTKRFIKK